MQNIFKLFFNSGTHTAMASFGLLLLRIAVGALMLTHGYGKFMKLVGDDPIKFSDPIGIGVTASLALAVFAEFFCSLFIIVGIATRFAAIPLLITMLVAAFIVHADDPFSKQELPMLYAAIYTLLLMSGAGKLSVDEQINKL